MNSNEVDQLYKSMLINLFPELAESEGERIRKALIDGFTVMKESKNCGKTFSNHNIPVADILAWLDKQGEVVVDKELSDLLNKVICHFINEPNIPYSERDEVSKKIIPYVKQLERQGEQKPNPCDGCINRKGCINCENGELRETEQKTDDWVTPKFKDGDWIIDIQGVSVNQIIGYEDDSYHIKTSCSQFYLPMKLTEKNYRLWTIQDARDGDVLYSPCLKLLWIYKDEKTYYVGSNLNYNSGSIVINKPVCIPTDVQPATKEQRKQLEKAMADAGYTFDFEKKELKKIEQKPATWSEEDESHINRIIEHFEGRKKDLKTQWVAELHNKEINWLKSLKDRVQPQPKQEWSEKDNEHVNSLLKRLEGLCRKEFTTTRFAINEDEDWLKSLKERYTWKPSDGQMEAVKEL